MTRYINSFFTGFLLCFLCTAQIYGNTFFDDPLKKNGTIVIDPGHGGSDYGIQGPKGLYEKNITLSIAELVLKELEKNYQVFLTRNDDYKVSLLRRASIANNKKADLFISIHTGGSFNQKASGMRLLYFKPDAKPGVPEKKAETFIKESETLSLWDSLQQKHILSSFNLAKSIKLAINDENIQITGARFFVLKGADMPAVIIETGFQTNSGDGNNLSKGYYIEQIAKNIAEGVQIFLKNKKNFD